MGYQLISEPEGKTQKLVIDGRTVLVDIPVMVTLDAAEPAALRFPGSATSRSVTPIGHVPNVDRFNSCHRYEPFWMTPKVGTDLRDVAIETQYVLVRQAEGGFVLLVPIVKDNVRTALQGCGTGLELVAETGDSAVPVGEFAGLFVAAGDDPYELMTEAAARFADYVGTVRLRAEKSLPEFVGKFGWCTWDAFYGEVSPENIRAGLESFRKGGIEPRYLIIDDGWLSTRTAEDGSKRLTAFEPNEKFPGGLAPTVQMAKEEFEIETVLAWHAMTGYWGGVDPSFGGYGAEIQERVSSPGIYSYVQEMSWWGPAIGLVPKENIHRFFHDFHRYLRQQGVDGVKVDVQAQLEHVSEGSGGRVPLMRAYREALEGSVAVHFEGRLINCMSLANEMIYNALASNVTRSFTDFWPDKPASHGLHLFANAQNSVWFGEFIHPDWDMFQSGHAAGPFHAAGRAVSGGPVYVSDKPNGHNFEVLGKLVDAEGDVLLADLPGRPTRDCLLHDVTKEDVLLKVFSLNNSGGVIGAFNAKFDENAPDAVIGGHISPSDVAGLEGDTFAVYAHSTRELRVMATTETWPIELPQLGWEVFTISPIVAGVAPIGPPDKLNSGAAALAFGDGTFRAGVWSGEFLAYAAERPGTVLADGAPIDFEYDPETGALRFFVELGPVDILLA